MKDKIKIIIGILIFLTGLSVMLYPSVSNYLHQKNQVGVIDDYRKKAEEMSRESIDEIIGEAREYNTYLADMRINGKSAVPLSDYDYQNLLNINDGVMAYISIPVCDINLPIRHGCGEDVLQISAGHMPQSSLPIGGINTHAVITAHRGLPSAKLFTNIDRLEEGDQFYIHGLNETLAYEVDQIKVVLPEDASDLYITEGEDYVTLITCTPYGINTHRLLVRGSRTEYIPQLEEEQKAESRNRSFRTIMLYAAGIVTAAFIILIICIIKKKTKKS